MAMKNARRNHRVLLQSEGLRDRMFVRMNYQECKELYEGMGLAKGERLFLQSYVTDFGWHTRAARGDFKGSKKSEGECA